MLTASEEVLLARRIERGDLSAKNRMIESNLRLVLSIAGSYRNSDVPFVDLVQEGTVGLVRAVERFDHRRGLKFSTYAVPWIKSSIHEALATSQVIRIPPNARRQMASVRRSESEFELTGRGRASSAMIAASTGLSETTVRALRGVARVTRSLDETVGDDPIQLADLIADDRAVDPAEAVIANERQSELSETLGSLPDRHREVLVRRYGLKDGRAQTYQEIGRWLGVGEERSRQIEREALHRLRTIVTAQLDVA